MSQNDSQPVAHTVSQAVPAEVVCQWADEGGWTSDDGRAGGLPVSPGGYVQVMGRITDRLFWTEEGQAKTDERFRQARDPQSIEGQWRRVCISTSLSVFTGVLFMLNVLLGGRRWTDFRIGYLAFWSVCLVLTLLDFGRKYRRKRRGDWQPRLRPPAQTGTERVLRYFGLR